jgi:hypothetical protein
MTTPNPTRELITCVRCRHGVTFTEDGVCERCRAGDRKIAKKKHKEDDR